MQSFRKKLMSGLWEIQRRTNRRTMDERTSVITILILGTPSGKPRVQNNTEIGLIAARLKLTLLFSFDFLKRLNQQRAF